jgi:hypothetical protein
MSLNARPSPSLGCCGIGLYVPSTSSGLELRAVLSFALASKAREEIVGREGGGLFGLGPRGLGRAKDAVYWWSGVFGGAGLQMRKWIWGESKTYRACATTML